MFHSNGSSSTKKHVNHPRLGLWLQSKNSKLASINWEEFKASKGGKSAIASNSFNEKNLSSIGTRNEIYHDSLTRPTKWFPAASACCRDGETKKDARSIMSIQFV